jgi:hypothetical protein
VDYFAGRSVASALDLVSDESLQFRGKRNIHSVDLLLR